MSRQVLVVDDSRTARMLCGAAIRTHRPDFRLLEAADGSAALDLVAGGAPDCAIIDMNMPGMDGIALAGALRARFPALPICLLTANVQASTRSQAEQMQINFFSKPITSAAVADMLARMGV